MTRGTSGSARYPTATCSRRSAPAARRSSPTTIDHFTEHGIRLASGSELPADIIVTATGLDLLAFGGIHADRRRAGGRSPEHARLQGDDAQRRAELRVRDRLHELVLDAEGRPCLRLPLPAARVHGRARIRHVRARTTTARRWRRVRCWTSAPATSSAPWTRLPRQGDRLPWSLAMSYRQDVQNLRRGAIEDPCLRFSRSPAATPGPLAAASAG